jgi:hypothetical protein
MNVDQIFQAIRTLPAPDQHRLVERVATELGVAPSAATPPGDPFLGMLADAPEIADEILRIATEGRHDGREVPDHDESRS